jgi:hypothetical protein
MGSVLAEEIDEVGNGAAAFLTRNLSYLHEDARRLSPKRFWSTVVKPRPRARGSNTCRMRGAWT